MRQHQSEFPGVIVTEITGIVVANGSFRKVYEDGTPISGVGQPKEVAGYPSTNL